MSEENTYLSNYKTNTLYIHPKEDGQGAYVTTVYEDEEEQDNGELQISSQIKLGVSAFFVNKKSDYSTFKLTKLRLSEGNWVPELELNLSSFLLAKMKDFLQLLSSLDLKDAQKNRIALQNEIDPDALTGLLKTDAASKILQFLEHNPNLSRDVFAIASKEEALKEFHQLLFEFDNYKEAYIKKYQPSKEGEEDLFQHFFERNTWIFGIGLNYVFLDKVRGKLESVVKGYDYQSNGKRVDALLKTKAEVSQYVLIEIKRHTDPLLNAKKYRSGVWGVSKVVTEAVSQIQKTVFDFVAEQSTADELKDEDGYRTGERIYKIQPKSYLVIGSLKQIKEHDDKIVCFELFRNSIASPEIITYDELYYRAQSIVDTISKQSYT